MASRSSTGSWCTWPSTMPNQQRPPPDIAVVTRPPLRKPVADVIASGDPRIANDKPIAKQLLSQIAAKQH